ncbi:MAG: hypothetical protein ACRDO2_10770 [Nocardioidaceae bacterium]
MFTGKRIIGTVALLLASLLISAPTTAVEEPRGDRFRFTGATDEDNNGKAETRAFDLIYHRDLQGVTPTLDAEAGWVDGDRRAYRCGFAFLQYRGFIVGRVTVSKFQDPVDKKSGYVKINDRFMREPARNFDGTPNTTGRQTRDCTVATEAYEPFSGTGEFPVLTYQHGPHAIDVRDFADEADVLVSNPSMVFDLVSATATKVVVIAYEKNNRKLLPMASIYYELVPDVERGLEVGELTPGTMHPVSLHVGCNLDCGMHEHEH